MLTRRTVTASDVPTLRTPAQMKPPTFRRCQAFHTPVATWFRSGIHSTMIFLHFAIPLKVARPVKSLRHSEDLPENRDWRRPLAPVRIICDSARSGVKNLLDNGIGRHPSHLMH